MNSPELYLDLENAFSNDGIDFSLFKSVSSEPQELEIPRITNLDPDMYKSPLPWNNQLDNSPYDDDDFDPDMDMPPSPLNKQYNNDRRRRKYDVFLSFRGEDTRASFASHLYASLQTSGIIVFKDDHSLQRGHRISKSLVQAIQDSSISVIIFSKNYADSKWCMQELMHIMECHRTIGQVVLPVFYDVDPSQVRRQTSEFGKAFQNLLNRVLKVDEFMVPKWRVALHDAAALAGFVALNSRLLTSLSAF